MSLNNPANPTTQDHATEEFTAELIFDNPAIADAAENALLEAGFAVEARPDWDDIGDGSCAWLMATAIASDVHVLFERVEAIIAPFGGTIWVCGTPEFNHAFNNDLELPGKLQ